MDENEKKPKAKSGGVFSNAAQVYVMLTIIGLIVSAFAWIAIKIYGLMIPHMHQP